MKIKKKSFDSWIHCASNSADIESELRLNELVKKNIITEIIMTAIHQIMTT